MEWLPFATFGFSVVTAIGGGFVALAVYSHRANVKLAVGELRDTVNARTQEIAHAMAEHEAEDLKRFSEVRMEISTVRRDVEVTFGDSLTAIRAQFQDHMHRLELADGQQRVDVLGLLSDTRKGMYERLDAHKDELGDKIDGLSSSVHQLEVNFAAAGMQRRASAK